MHSSFPLTIGGDLDVILTFMLFGIGVLCRIDYFVVYYEMHFSGFSYLVLGRERAFLNLPAIDVL